MPSWQSRVLHFTQVGFRALTGHGRILDVAQERRNAAFAERLFRAPPAGEYRAVSAGGVPAEWVIPPGRAAERVILYVHGGGFYSGSLAGTRSVAAKFARACGARALTFAYRLAPEHGFPAALDDAQAVYGWLLASGVSPARIGLLGDSAGGTLALALLVRLRDQGQSLPGCAVCLSPATDLTMAGDTWTRHARRDLLLNPAKVRAAIDLYLGGSDSRAPLASPLYADLTGLPPLLVLVGSEECLLSDATRLAAKAQTAGVATRLEVWKGMQHGWHLLADFLPEGRRAIEGIGEFVAAACGPAE